MKRVLVIVGMLAAGLAFAADAKNDATKKEQHKFTGTWKAVSIKHDGKEVPKDELDKVSLDREGR